MNKKNSDSKADFLFTLSHEIKNALNIINGMCCMIKNNTDDRERTLKYLNRICSVTEYISELLNKCIDISVFKSNRFRIDQKPFKMDELKEEMYQLLLPLAEKKNIDFQVIYKHDRNKEVIGDYGRLLQIMINLATNSIKYTPNGGNIILRLDEEFEYITETTYRFVCIDDGIGMDEEFQKHIFEPFTRAEDDRVRQVKGTGLGMTIVRDMVDAMGGSIHIASAIDTGTTVTIRLKLKNYIRKG